ncbi:acyltransferase [Arthrobacter jiangjiafuii]|uniref:Acyltransferase n=1 Tax=Arthrobacter jiangjiafuii TaxID=2817475 RepID=A0A975M4B9_9MICC|nr:acyltransferase family protein [Arthrobacter jiangjiafuii]MBP3042540.1 acyltransferase [Arthrobacter jiangjiafuii]QWC09721.1 acyltransferase [Arthrobacter jiangjiafuii]
MAVTTQEAEHVSAASPQGKARKPRFRTDIQAMRALAVVLVVLNHLWPLRLPGGYVGVDVFFVISGFLISSHLMREIEATGRVRIGAFYSRRARRLFPAAFVVLAASMLVAVAFLPHPRWIPTAQEVLASVFYGENWLLAAKSVDYSAMTEAASAVQHYWSLSVEEQFYLLWPLALILLSLLARRTGSALRPVVLTGVVSVAVLSLAYSIYVTAAAPDLAYFATPARVWEFAVGALIGLAGVRLKSLVLRNVLAVAGFGMIIASALTFDGLTPFPGWTAMVPVVGSAVVILSGTGEGRLVHDRLTGLAPVQFIGKISYSLYLWHWPLIVAAPFVFGVVPTAPYKLVILAVSILLAWLTKRWVEDSWIKSGGRRVERRGNGFRKPIAGMAAVAVAAVLLGVAGNAKENQAVEFAVAGADGPCYGAAAVGNRDCGDPFAIPVAVPDMGNDNVYTVVPDECGEPADHLLDGGSPATCDFSNGNQHAEVVWLVGDSHAQQWQMAVLALGQERGWIVKRSYLGGCPLTDATVVSFAGSKITGEKSEHCTRWTRAVTGAVETDRPSRVFVSMFASREVVEDGSDDPQNVQFANGLVRDWQRWIDAGITVVPIYDPPLNGVGRAVECLSLNGETPLSCAVPKDQAIESNPLADAVERMDHDQIKPVDLTDYFCDARSCYSAVGGVSLYYDANHLNGQLVKQLAPQIASAID